MVAAVLDQRTVWVNATGVHDLTTMDPHHRANLIPFLRANVRAIWSICNPDLPHPSPSDLEEWLEGKPLMRRLVELEKGRPFEARQATAERNAAHEAATGYRKVRTG